REREQQRDQYFFHGSPRCVYLASLGVFFSTSPKAYLLISSMRSTGGSVSVIVPFACRSLPAPPASILMNLSPRRPFDLIDATASSYTFTLLSMRSSTTATMSF